MVDYYFPVNLRFHYSFFSLSRHICIFILRFRLCEWRRLWMNTRTLYFARANLHEFIMSTTTLLPFIFALSGHIVSYALGKHSTWYHFDWPLITCRFFHDFFLFLWKENWRRARTQNIQFPNALFRLIDG